METSKIGRLRGKFASPAGLASVTKIAHHRHVTALPADTTPKGTKMQRNNIRLSATILLFMTAGRALASSDEAWKEFAADVEAKCRQAAAASIADARAVVDPIGSAHYGLALVTGRPKGANGFVTHICVYDKQSKGAEIGSELDTQTLNLLPEE
ncbi:hypothetical protein BCL32_5035 [Rhizobium mongolense USDA 1844]|uniref:Uncharacterized protein n=1 Tax=Rhizobium mongolense USDA 1844 TaxID=1079460 RepID=A0A559SQZ1_9HYPH|nr:hypothetical protein BCL32_5035 [Rhizobium mongolense USDA 1844]